jgi:hypothetical protein
MTRSTMRSARFIRYGGREVRSLAGTRLPRGLCDGSSWWLVDLCEPGPYLVT